MKDWINYRWFIADTELSKIWAKKVYKNLQYMGKTLSRLQALKERGRTTSPEYKKAMEYFDIAHKNFAAQIKKPVRVSSKVLNKAKLKKLQWQEQMRKKYKLKRSEING